MTRTFCLEMKLNTQAVVRTGLVLVALVLVCIGSLFSGALSAVDYFIQGVILVSVFVVPIVGSSLRSTFWVPILIGLVWGLWRMTYFDPVTKNDIPGVGYLVASIQFGLIGVIVHAARKAMLRLRYNDG